VSAFVALDYRIAGIYAEYFNSTDDLISEENDVVQKALKRLPPKVAYDRVYRLRRAMQVRNSNNIG
jgi:ubiquinol-cytochrome c reductase subunit 7